MSIAAQVPGRFDHDRYALWDASYVLGALSTDDRREFEQHLAVCAGCSRAVAELAGMPALLSRVQPDARRSFLDEFAAGRADGAVGQPVDRTPPTDLLARISDRDRSLRRRQRRRMALVAAAAAAITATAVVVPAELGHSDRPSLVVALPALVDKPLSANVRLYRESWGTRIDLTCSYGDVAGLPAGTTWNYGLYVIDGQSRATMIASWTTRPGSTVQTGASTDLAVDQIRSVQIRSIDTGAVLMSRDLPAG